MTTIARIRKSFVSGCEHPETKEISMWPYSGPVNPHAENRAAHGNVGYTVECTGCGARRAELHNHCQRELGPWGLDRAARRAAAISSRRALDISRAGRPAPVRVSTPTRSVSVSIDHKGMLVIGGEHEPRDRDRIVAALQSRDDGVRMIDHARRIRLRYLHYRDAVADI